MGGLRSWAGSLLSLVVFFVVRSMTAGLAAPMFVAVTVACVYIWLFVLRVPEMKNIKPEEDGVVSGLAASTSAAKSAAPTAATAAATTTDTASATVAEHPKADNTSRAETQSAGGTPRAARPEVESAAAVATAAAAAVLPDQSSAGAGHAEGSSVPNPASEMSSTCSSAAAGTTEDALPQHTTIKEEHRDVCEGDASAGDDKDKEEEHEEKDDKEEKEEEEDEGEVEEDEQEHEKEEKDKAAQNSAAEDSDASTDQEERERREREEEDEHANPERAQELRLEGNEFFKAGKLHDAREAYSEALYLTPSADKKEKAVLFSNRAACHLKLSRWEDVVSDCKQAVELDEKYAKAYNRRSVAYENLGKWHDANEDLKKAIELDPSIRSKEYKRQAMLEQIAQEQFEKDKEEMMGKLKDLGNMVLGKFGMSTDNFKCEKDPSTGSYSIKFQN